MQAFLNPFRPGAGQKPPYLAGRMDEQIEFDKMLEQQPILQNLILTGLRGVGKTSLLEALKPHAINHGWLWAGTDLSESASLTEHNLSIRIMTDISSLTSAFEVLELEKRTVGFKSTTAKVKLTGNYSYLMNLYNTTPGLEADKLKNVLTKVWEIVKKKANGIVLAYDEAQILKDQKADKQFPLSLLLEVTQYLQRMQIPVLLILTGLPTLFPNLVETRTYAERMFHILTLGRLNEKETKEAISKPIDSKKSPVVFSPKTVTEIYRYSGGYPYFIQFLCKEVFDSFLQQMKLGIKKPNVVLSEIVRKLDTDFYAGRWARVTDRQRELLKLIAQLNSAEEEFAVQDICSLSKKSTITTFSPSNVNQMLLKLVEGGMVYKNRHGKYSFAVPMLSDFIRRQIENEE